ncbi:hypothetical protein CBS147332_6214 [Penicillium roqueforti]|nr:hypothetical protein CBS147332_6214 [Penicillium roqueforti]KAI3100695.1 hypothetical protein CBS147331_8280 [Penicillium roqueforti]
MTMEILPTPQGMGTELSMTGLIAITWTGTGVSILFTSARIAIRIVITDSAGSTHLLYSVQYDRARYCRPWTSLHPLQVCDHWNILVRAMERKSLIPSTLLDDIQWVASVPAGLVGHRCVRSLGIYRMLDWVGVHMSPAI